MRLSGFVIFGAAACVSAVAPSPAEAADAFYIGKWKFSGAVVAPWAEPQRKPDGKERARLMGKFISVKPKAIAGPDPFGCKGPHYAVKDYPPNRIFQGVFEEMQSKDKSIDPARLAASLGFAGPHIKTLETGCEFDFHFVDAMTVEVGLNDYVYTLKKQ